MSFTPILPVSKLLNSIAQEETSTRKSREEWKKLKELEEARKQGNVPAQTDELGRDINPHIPQYIAQAPWYFGAMTATLKHQREQMEKVKEFNRIGNWYHKGLISAKPTKFRKGACENCGSLTHKKKDCVERPRRILAKFSNKDLASDEILIAPILDCDYDGKRDRWNGYDSTEYTSVVQEYAKIEEAKKILKSQKLESALNDPQSVEGKNESDELSVKEKPNEVELSINENLKEVELSVKGDLTGVQVESKKEPNKDNPIIDEDEEEEDEDKYADSFDMPGTKHDSKQRITVRNLRIREDTAKYLYNLDINSAFYDPKTRSMRANPFCDIKADPAQVKFAGDNFIRYSGDTQNIAKQQLFAWEAMEKGIDVNQQSEPTKLELLYREFKEKKEELKDEMRKSLYDKYGGQDDYEPPPVQLILAQNESYVEYSRSGKIVKGQELPAIRSKYLEDVFPQNHTSVWGSFWYNYCWGYKCCCSFVKQSYCTSSDGIKLFKEKLELESNIASQNREEPNDHLVNSTPKRIKI